MFRGRLWCSRHLEVNGIRKAKGKTKQNKKPPPTKTAHNHCSYNCFPRYMGLANSDMLHMYTRIEQMGGRCLTEWQWYVKQG